MDASLHPSMIFSLTFAIRSPQELRYQGDSHDQNDTDDRNRLEVEVDQFVRLALRELHGVDQDLRKIRIQIFSVPVGLLLVDVVIDEGIRTLTVAAEQLVVDSIHSVVDQCQGPIRLGNLSEDYL